MTLVRMRLHASIVVSGLALAAPVAFTPAAFAGDIVYWSMWNEQEPNAKVITALAQAYMQNHPGTKITITWNGRQNQVKVRTALNGGTSIDLIDGELDNLAGGVVAAGGALPLDDLLESAGPDGKAHFRDVFLPKILDVGKQKGKYYQIPYDYLPYAFFYNKEMWTNAGVTAPPKTWDELLAAYEKIKAAGFNGIAVEGDVDVYNVKFLSYMLERLNGPEFLMKAAEDKTGETWKDPSVLEALRKIRILWDKGYIPEESRGYRWPAAQQTLGLGKTSSELVGAWLPIEISDLAGPDFQWGTFSFPTVDGKGDVSHLEVLFCSYVVLAGSKNQTETEDFVKYMMSHDSQQRYASEALRPAANNSVQWPKQLADARAMTEGATLVLAEIDGVRAKYPDYVTNILNAEFNKEFLGSITAEQFVSDMASQTKNYWASK